MIPSHRTADISLHGGLEPQLAHHIETIPVAGACAGGCWYEPKWDGFRALAYVDADRGVALESVPLGSRCIALALGMATLDQSTARGWFERFARVGVEGIMIKPGEDPYRPGNRAAWGKVKHFTTTEAIVGGVTGTLRVPKDVILGRYSSDTGEFMISGRTTPLRSDAARKLGGLLTAAENDHPWPETLPPGWRDKAPTEYIRVRPEVAVEIRTEVAATATRWRHGLRYIRLRPDLEPSHVPTDLDIETAH